MKKVVSIVAAFLVIAMLVAALPVASYAAVGESISSPWYGIRTSTFNGWHGVGGYVFEHSGGGHPAGFTVSGVVTKGYFDVGVYYSTAFGGCAGVFRSDLSITRTDCWSH